MLCIDCLVKDRKENKAITVSNGFALCRDCLFKFYSKMFKANGNVMEELEDFLNHEAGVDEEEGDDSTNSPAV